MKILSNMRISQRIFILTVVPLIVVLLFSFDYLNSSFKQERKMEQLDVAIQYVQQLSPLLSALKEEHREEIAAIRKEYFEKYEIKSDTLRDSTLEKVTEGMEHVTKHGSAMTNQLHDLTMKMADKAPMLGSVSTYSEKRTLSEGHALEASKLPFSNKEDDAIDAEVEF